jgi:hypothetical protein
MCKAAHPFSHQIHTTGGASSFITMVVVIVMLFVLFVQSCLIVITCRMYTSAT